MIRRIALLCVLASLWACGSSEGSADTAADTLTRAQRDSAIAEMPIPGAGAIGTALEAQQRANERALAHDTIH